MKPYLYAEKIQFKVKERNEPIISETTLNIAEEEFVVVLGTNGSGKSTLIKILASYLKPTSGRVFLDQWHSVKKIQFGGYELLCLVPKNGRYYLLALLKNMIKHVGTRFSIT